MTAITTVRIRSAETASGFIIVNEADFDPAKQRLWETKPAAAPQASVGGPIPAEPDADKAPDKMTLA